MLKTLVAGYIVWGAWTWFQGRAVHAPDGISAPRDPVQVEVPNGPSTRIGQWTLKVRAHYRITAKILSVERYHWDALSALIPEDLALGWGPMSDNRTLKIVDISQSNRFYYWHVPAGSPLSTQAIISHSANTHVIPADALAARDLNRLRPGETVTLTGDLVDAVRDDGASIHTSMTRTDTGAGACEVMLVRDVEVAGRL
ncbi:MAG TPA: hypothetical protein VHY75_16530 [Steroidobacteraceae bacterium]|nr:hypothetical protein [Steroidobacteraceae bacterium]